MSVEMLDSTSNKKISEKTLCTINAIARPSRNVTDIRLLAAADRSPVVELNLRQMVVYGLQDYSITFQHRKGDEVKPI